LNIKQFESNLENVKKLTPQVFKETMQLSVPFFVLHKKIYEKGENLISKEFNINQSELDVLAALYYMGGDDFMMSPTKLYKDIVSFENEYFSKLNEKEQDTFQKLIYKILN